MLPLVLSEVIPGTFFVRGGESDCESYQAGERIERNFAHQFDTGGLYRVVAAMFAILAAL